MGRLIWACVVLITLGADDSIRGLAPQCCQLVIAPHSRLRAEEGRALEIGHETQLLVDGHLLSSTVGLQRTLGKVVKQNAGKPIFTEGWFYGSVLHDENRFKLWYRKPGNQGFGLAHSNDGLKFVHQADIVGIPFAGDYTLAVELDPLTNAPDRRFMASFDAPGMAAGLAFSNDGIRWKPANEGKPITHRAADSYNQILFDPNQKCYRLFTRTDFGAAGGAGEIRGTREMINANPRDNPTNWKTVNEWKFDREGESERHRRQSYAVTCWIWRKISFALLSVYEYPNDFSEGVTTDPVKRHERDVMNYYLASRRANEPWDFHWVYAGLPLVPRGTERAFDKDLLLPASTIVTHHDQHWIYYAGANERHGSPEVKFERTSAIGLATLPRDRLAGWEAREASGVAETKSLFWPGRKLHLNIAAPTGSCRVEILSEDGAPIPGLEAVRSRFDDLDWEPKWKDPRALDSMPKHVRLRVTLTNAIWFAFEVRQ